VFPHRQAGGGGSVGAVWPGNIRLLVSLETPTTRDQETCYGDVRVAAALE
jgi:hypothetical protein